ncbi:dehydrogenase/reductase SDR family member 11-like isoform X3 [Haliotis rubra]|uniref:dehydrogenase/reductase SDR family member 11-like isoform X3 n=1 Tax=Haliotis rubra TaxID=36100 RepID=UPI001EE58294|nr:dehydrogenase/reductase SDR family member 11-like isoform X3 [Haliotis rubra]
MQRWSGRVALVTGASAGIGAGLVKALVKHGMKVVGCARNIDKIQKLADELKNEPGKVKAVRCDVSKEEDVLAMFQTIKADPDLGGVDVCINNAGLAHNDPLLTGSTQGWKHMLEVNVLGLCMCTREAFKSMQERKVDDGHIILLNSVLGKTVGPMNFSHFYGATKFAVSAIYEGLIKELNEINSGIRVTSVAPGLVRTEILYRMKLDDVNPEVMYQGALDVDDIAAVVIFALGTPPNVQIHDVTVKPLNSLL